MEEDREYGLHIESLLPGQWIPDDIREQVEAIEAEYQRRQVIETIQEMAPTNLSIEEIQTILGSTTLSPLECSSGFHYNSINQISVRDYINVEPVAIPSSMNSFYIRDYLNVPEIPEGSLYGDLNHININREDNTDRPISITPFIDTPQRKLARKRNWNKFRLSGFTLNKQGLTEDEYNLYLQFKEMLEESWDNGTRRLGLIPGKKKDNNDEEEVTVEIDLPF